MLGFCELAGLHWACPLIGTADITHIHFADTAEFTTFSNNLEHFSNMLLCTLLKICIIIVAYVHLSADTVNLGNTIGLPLLNPTYERLHLSIIVPIRLEVVVVDEKLDVLGTILAGQTTCLAHIVEIAHIVLPEESITAHIPCSIGITIGIISIGVLQDVVALAIVATAGNSFVDEIPAFHFSVASFHHALDPLIHRINQCIVHLLFCLRNHLGWITFELDGLNIDVAHEIATLKQ